MLRYTVIKTIKYKGEIYEPGDLLPATFTKKDKERHLWSRRIVPVEVAEEVEIKSIEDKTILEPIENSQTIDSIIQENKIASESTIEASKVNISPKIPVKQVATKK